MGLVRSPHLRQMGVEFCFGTISPQPAHTANSINLQLNTESSASFQLCYHGIFRSGENIGRVSASSLLFDFASNLEMNQWEMTHHNY